MADENRRMSEQFGDLEYEYDLLDHLDPIARAGFDPSRVRVGDPNDRMTSADSHYQPLSDMITINPRDLANKATHAHEFRERGIDILLEELRRDGFEFIQKYGKDLYLKLSDLRDAIKNQNRARMIKDGDYNKNFEEMISEFYEKHEDVNQGAEYYAGELFSPKFGYVRGETARDSRITTPAEKMALLKEHQRKTGTPIIKYVPPPDTAQEQMDRLETDNQVAFREYLKTNPADRVERAFFKTPYAEGERRRTRPLFESVELLSQFAEKQNKKYGVRDPENFAQGGPVMRGIGTLNETARNMTRGPRGIGAYQQFASGGEAMGPPPTRGPDPQGIGYFQQFADGGPVYMQEGGDPNFKLLVQAVQKVESNFDSRAVSEDGAIGLMQILPTTAAQPGYEKYGAENVFDIAERLMGFRDERTVENARALLFDPEINVEFGTKYLQAMIRDSGGDILQALQKYNAGVGNYQAFEEDPKNNPLDQEAVQYPIKVTAAYQNFDPSNPLELAQFSNRPEAASQMMAMYEQPEPELVRPRLRPEFLGDKGVTTSLRPQLRPQGIMSIQDPAVMDRVVAQVQEELPPTQEERDLYEKYSPENMFPDAGLTEGEMIRRERFAPKDGDAEPYRQPPSMLEQIDQFFQRFAPSRKPERVIQPKPTPMQYRSA